MPIAFIQKIDLFDASTEIVLMVLIIASIGIFFLKRHLRGHYDHHVEQLSKHINKKS